MPSAFARISRIPSGREGWLRMGQARPPPHPPPNSSCEGEAGAPRLASRMRWMTLYALVPGAFTSRHPVMRHEPSACRSRV